MNVDEPFPKFGQTTAPEYFNICVKVFEATDLPHPNISSYVCVQIGKDRRQSKTVTHSDRPYFDEYFVFDLYTDFNSMYDTIITLYLYQPKSLKFDNLIGRIALELGTVWNLDEHSMHRWLNLSLPADPTAQSKGFLNCKISIEAEEKHRKQLQLRQTEMPDVIGGTRARYVTRFYNCIGLESQVLNYSDPPDIHIRVSFAGTSETTSKRKLKESVEWNEQILFIELTPALFQRIVVEIVIGKRILASKNFYLSDICYQTKDGFLPTYGPTYVHFYDKNYLYIASLCMEIDTELITLYKYKEQLHACLKSSVSPPNLTKIDKQEAFLCYGVIFDAIFTKKAHEIHNAGFSMSFGNSEYLPDDAENCTSTVKYKVKPGDVDCSYVMIEETKPCLFVRSEWTDTRHRLSNQNILKRLALDLRTQTQQAQNFISRGSEKNAFITLRDALKKVKSEAKTIPETFSVGKAKLDSQRSKFLTEQIKDIQSINTKGNDIDFLLEQANLILSIIDEMRVDIQDSLPVLCIIVTSGPTMLGMCRVDPQDIIFSTKEKKKGLHCGRITSLLIENIEGSIIGKVDAWLWLGLWENISACLQSLPSGHQSIKEAVKLPISLEYSKHEMYLGACNIFSGIISEVEDSEGLCNFYVKIYVSHQGQVTKSYKQSLTPLWKDTLTFDLKLYPLPNYIEKNPPLVLVELWNGHCSPPKLLGSNFVEPRVKLQPFSSVEYILQWTNLGTSQILAAFEIVQITIDSVPCNLRRSALINPKFLDPPMDSYTLEVVFWGLRSPGVKPLTDISQPQIIVRCGYSEIKSEILSSAFASFNYQRTLQSVKVELPETKFYTPPLALRMIESGKPFGIKIDTNVHRYSCRLPTKKQWSALTTRRRSVVDLAKSRYHSTANVPDLIPLIEVDAGDRYSVVQGQQFSLRKVIQPLVSALGKVLKPFNRFRNKDSLRQSPILKDDVILDEDQDWWYKYHSGDIMIYKHPLEKERGFNGFTDVLRTFDLEKTRGRNKIVTRVKLMMCLYKWPVKARVVNIQGQDLKSGPGVLRHTDLKTRVKLLVRVYCLRAANLHPADVNGSADPFIEIATPSRRVSDQEHYLVRQLNPVFGTCLEIPVEFPRDHMLSVRVMDYDRMTVNDLIGETLIDLENRFYSKHRATCGLAKSYFGGGKNKWRDLEKPSHILERLCNSHNLPLPEYYEKSVVVASKEFVNEKKFEDKEEQMENLALNALHHWKEAPFVGTLLVPEHVEVRPLFNENRPGILQGKLEMWVDMFDLSLGEVPPPVDITKRLPEKYELRVIIWNTAKVPLVDNSYFVGKKHTDIFIKGWLYSHKTLQKTDVHYTSTNGEGNFNWRFVFPLEYYTQERKMVVYKKTIFDMEKEEQTVPPLLHLQVWDNDRLSANDFIGGMVLDLTKMPRGAGSKNKCKITSGISSQNKVNLFRTRHEKGWWAFTKLKEKGNSFKPVLGGVLEAEFEIVTADEAISSPAGIGREEPAALPPPKRPEFRTKFWLAPVRVFTHLVCGVHRKKVITLLLLAALGLFLMIALYSIPMFIIKRLIGA